MLGLAGLLALILSLSLAAVTSAATPAPTWYQETLEPSPSPRDGASMAFDPAIGPSIVLFGGQMDEGATSHLLEDTWEYDVGRSRWSDYFTPAHSPPPRRGASMAFDPGSGRVILFGGEGEGGDLNDTWIWNGHDWTEQPTQTSPSPRQGASMAFDPSLGEMVLFGGSGPGGPLEDTWVFDGIEWAQVGIGSFPPPAMSYSSMAFDPGLGQVLLFGGEKVGGVRSNETWAYNGREWIKHTSQPAPLARSEASMAFDPTIGETVLFGGSEPGGSLGDTWTYDGREWTRQPITGSPSPRSGATMDFDPRSGRMVLFGGFDFGRRFDETWTYGPTSGPDATIASPVGGATYTVGEGITTSFACSEASYGPGLQSCTDSNGVVASGGQGSGELDTSYPGPHSYTVTALSADGREDIAAIGYKVIKATPTLTTQVSGSVALGGSVAVTATLAGGGSPGGTIVFRAYGPEDPTCSAAPAYTSERVAVAGSGSYAFSPALTPGAAGTYRVVAAYSGDAGNESVASSCDAGGASVTVGKAPTSTALSVSPGSARFGDAVTFTASVAGFHPGGVVTLREGKTTLGSASPDAGGIAVFTTNFTVLAIGTHLIHAEYGGDEDNLPSSSPEIEESVLGATSPSATPASPPPSSSPQGSSGAQASPSAPRVSISHARPPGHRGSGWTRYTFRFGDQAGDTVFLCSLDFNPFRECTSPRMYRRMAPGRHVFRVKSINAAGVESAVEKVVFFADRRRH